MKKTLRSLSLLAALGLLACNPQAGRMGLPAGSGPMGAGGDTPATVEGDSNDSGTNPAGKDSFVDGATTDSRNLYATSGGPRGDMPIGTVAPDTDVGNDWLLFLKGTRSGECRWPNGPISVHVSGRVVLRRVRDGYEDPVESEDLSIRVLYGKWANQVIASSIDVPITSRYAGGGYQVVGDPDNYIDFTIDTERPRQMTFVVVERRAGVESLLEGMNAGAELREAGPSPLPVCRHNLGVQDETTDYQFR